MRTEIQTYTKISAFENIKIEPFDVNKRYTKPHRHHKYLELVYFTKGTGMHYMDEEGYPIEPPLAFVVKKDEVHHWAIDSVPEGFVIIIKEDFLEKTLDKHLNIQLKALEKHRVIFTKDDTSLSPLFEIACKELKSLGSERDFLMEGILKAILSKILSFAPASPKQTLGEIDHLFIELLEKDLKNDVAYYAQALNTTSQNLNAVCKRKFDKTASTVIAEHIIKEAKRQLLYTDLSATEIAYNLSFGDVSHFVKFFKRFEQKTPLQFKKETLVP